MTSFGMAEVKASKSPGNGPQPAVEATEVVEALELDGVVVTVEVTGPTGVLLGKAGRVWWHYKHVRNVNCASFSPTYPSSRWLAAPAWDQALD